MRGGRLRLQWGGVLETERRDGGEGHQEDSGKNLRGVKYAIHE
jgi:hypothetical protein